MPKRKTKTAAAKTRARPYRREARYRCTMSLPLELAMREDLNAVADAHELSPVAVTRMAIAAGLPAVKRKLNRRSE